MAYNKAKEEYKWHLWKDAEEKKLRETGVDEVTIEQIRISDWAVFNSDRRYYRRLQDTRKHLDKVATNDEHIEIMTAEHFLESIEDEKLYKVLTSVDKLTLRATVMKMQGYSTCEIAQLLSITEKSIYRRMDRLKEKIKKVIR